MMVTGKNRTPGDMDVVVLCGGEGKRLREVVEDRPKPMAEINSRPFLDVLLDYVMSFGFRRFIFCVGYKSDYIKRYYENKNQACSILFSEEETLLGTAGAIANSSPMIQSELFLVMNGDSIINADLDNFIRFHMEKNGEASVVLTRTKESGEYGVINVANDQQILSFAEKSAFKGSALVNAGIYILSKSLINRIPPNMNYSLEKDFFPMIVRDSKVYGYETEAELIDIGTPERYEFAKLPGVLGLK